jgi:tRNA (guanine-N7-)-methyltransferase
LNAIAGDQNGSGGSDTMEPGGAGVSPQRPSSHAAPAAGPAIDTAPYTLELEQNPTPLAWETVFGNSRPVELEVGSGKGLFLVNAGAAEPGHNFLGIELSKKYAGLAQERVAKQRLSNVKVLAGDARAFLARFVPPASLHTVHVYFPDPWWKKRHKKRRVFTESLVVDLERGLRPGGELRVATDVEEYFGVICDLVAAHPRFEEAPIPEEVAQASLTNFERKYRLEGRPIYRKHYRFTGSETTEAGHVGSGATRPA